MPNAQRPLRIALSGYYGCGNTGDEAVLAGIVESFARRGAAADFTVLSQNPADTQARHGLRAVDRMNMAALKRALDECDLLISGGGSLLQDTTSLRSLLYYLWVIRLAHARRKPVMLYAQGIGPLRRRSSRLLTAMTLRRAKQITVRDEGSARLLNEIGVRRVPLEVTADPAFALTPASDDRARELLAEGGVAGERKLIGVALRPWPAGPGAEAYVRLAQELARVSGGALVFLPMQPPGDLELAHSVAGRVEGAVVIEQPLSPAEALAVCGQLDGLVAMRLHALIFGAAAGVPLVALSYDPKVRELMTRLGQLERAVDLAGFDASAAAAQLQSAMAEGDSLRAAIRGQAAKMTELALRNVDLALAAAR